MPELKIPTPSSVTPPQSSSFAPQVSSLTTNVWIGPPAGSAPAKGVTPSAMKWDYIEAAELGRGTTSTVIQGILKSSGLIYAIKRISMHEEFAPKIMKEVEILQSIPSHVNIVKYISHRVKDETLEIFLEHVPGGNLSSLIKNSGGLSETLAVNYLKQIVEGLRFLHAQGIWWRDCKSANCLLAADGTVKLTDLGASKKKEKMQITFGEKTILAETIQGSVPWMAPEVIVKSGYCDKADIWSLGILSLELVTGKNPWGNMFDNVFALMMQIATNVNGPDMPDRDGEGGFLTEEFTHMVRICLQRNPDDRPSAKELKELPLFNV